VKKKSSEDLTEKKADARFLGNRVSSLTTGMTTSRKEKRKLKVIWDFTILGYKK